MAWSEWQKEKSECDTAPTVDLNHYREPFRCQNCQQLIYNTRDGLPVPGAPIPTAVSNEFNKLCTLCAEMYWTLSARTYWIELHRQWVEEQKRRKKNLGDGKDYFA